MMKTKINPKNSNIFLRKKKDLSRDEIEKLKRSKLISLGKIEAWTAIGTNKQLAYSTHGFFRFFGKFPPPIATYLIDLYTNKNSTILDPMAGSGTTAVESMLKGRKCYIFDVNPLMTTIIKAKVTKVSKKMIEKELAKIVTKYKPANFQKYKNNFNGIQNPEHWFEKDTLNSLLGIKILIDNIKNLKTRNFFLICFVSIVRRVSKATTQQGRLFLDIETSIKNTLPIFQNKVESLKETVSKIDKKKFIKIYNQSILNKNKTHKYKNLFDLIIAHPPYFNSYKYSSINTLESYWMSIDRTKISKNEIREFFKVGKPDNYKKYVEDMSLALKNSLSMLKKNGRLALMIGDTVIRNKYIPVTKKVLDLTNLKKENIDKVILRVPKYTEASWASSQRRTKKSIGIDLNDFIIIIKK